jgi:hypothetical protein
VHGTLLPQVKQFLKRVDQAHILHELWVMPEFIMSEVSNGVNGEARRFGDFARGQCKCLTANQGDHTWRVEGGLCRGRRKAVVIFVILILVVKALHNLVNL